MMAEWIPGGILLGIVVIVFLYTAARVITKGITRTLDERKRHGSKDTTTRLKGPDEEGRSGQR